MKVLYWGPIAEVGKPALGGYEAANRKNIDKLRQHGVEVIEFPNPRINYRLGPIGKLAYIKLLLTPFTLLKYTGAEDVIIHHTPLYDNLIFPSIWLLWMSKILHIKILIDIRAGSLIENDKKKSSFWRKSIRYLLNNASLITVEGKSYLHDIPSVFNINRKIYYFPNLADCEELTFIPRSHERINMIYFGRITKLKGVDLLLKMMPLLDERFHLYLAGKVADDIKHENLNIDGVTYLGLLTPVELRKVLQNMHIFLFPTMWPGEGQSNSLIEAMQNGLIPIVSNQGFNEDVVADCGVVLAQGSKERDYCDAVKIVVGGNLDEQGKRAMQHIEKNHHIEKWILWLVDLYKKANKM